MRLFGIEKLAEDLAIEKAAEIHAAFQCLNIAESPIERLFWIAIIERLRGSDMPHAMYRSPQDWEVDVDGRKPEVLVSMQEKMIGRWPVDFTFRVRGLDSQKITTIVVECDGHDYHERTKEQAARDRGRDRELQIDGHKIFRFTGSELYRDPLGCADQVMHAVHQARSE